MSFRKLLILFTVLPFLSSCSTTGNEGLDGVLGQIFGQSELTVEEISDGLKEALHVGTDRVVDQVGKAGGYFDDADIHIPLPSELEDVQSALGKVGLSGMLDTLEQKLNEGAEKAAPIAKDLFWDAISEMTINDVMNIYNGPDDAATQYFRGKMEPRLRAEMRPVIEGTLNQVGAVRQFNDIKARYDAIPFTPDVNTDLAGYAENLALDGMFHYLAKEEAAIRNDPLKRTTELLRKVFGAI